MAELDDSVKFNAIINPPESEDPPIKQEAPPPPPPPSPSPTPRPHAHSQDNALDVLLPTLLMALGATYAVGLATGAFIFYARPE